MGRDPRFEGAGPDQAWDAALSQGHVAVQRCRSCRRAQLPFGVLCRACGGVDLASERASGHGIVYSSTTVIDREGAYNVALVDLAEGPRLMTRIEGLPPDLVRIGTPVKAAISEDSTHVLFTPDESA